MAMSSESIPILGGEKRRSSLAVASSNGKASDCYHLIPPGAQGFGGSSNPLLPEKISSSSSPPLPTSPRRTVVSTSLNSPPPEDKQRPGRMVKRSNGRSHVRHRLPPQSYLSYFSDLFTSVINAQWYVIVPLFFACYIISWLMFGTAWRVLAYSYGENNITCVYNVNDFSSAFLFSVEAQTTIGFGFRYPSSACGGGIFLLVLQSVVGLVLDSFLLGLMFAKLTRPRNRRKTIFFSNTAVIYDRLVKTIERDVDGRLVEKTEERRVLEFRIADVRRSQVVEAHVRLQLYWYQENTQREGGRGGGEMRQYDLDVGYDEGRDRIFLLTPVSVYHYITETSPLYNLSQEDLASSQLELVVVLEGIVEATGLTAQVLWSYTKDEIEFDCTFQPMTYYSETDREWVVDYTKLNALSSLSSSNTGPLEQPK